MISGSSSPTFARAARSGGQRALENHARLSRATEHEVDAIVAHVGCQLEFAFTCEETGSYRASERDTRYRGSSPRGCAGVFLQRLPERLHKILLLSVPCVFGIVRIEL